MKGREGRVRHMSNHPTLDHERTLWRAGYEYVAGMDEAGRGALAGPVVAAAVIFPCDDFIDDVADSKLMTHKSRERVAGYIEETAAGIGIGMCSPGEIDAYNILQATMEAMQRAVANLTLTLDPQYLLIDGNRCFPGCAFPYETLPKGDRRCHAIAAASIIAKVTRDRLMRRLHDEHSVYSWLSNVGYPTPGHYAALEEHGPTPHHRRSFRLGPAGTV